MYWKSPYYLLEDDFEVLLVNAAHVKHVPGRKTDTIDAAWLALLLSRGLLRASFVPPPPIRELRDLTRYRKALINERSREVNRIHKTLEDAGVKLSSVATDVMGVSGRDMMRALIGGRVNPQALAEHQRLRTEASWAMLCGVAPLPDDYDVGAGDDEDLAYRVGDVSDVVPGPHRRQTEEPGELHRQLAR